MYFIEVIPATNIPREYPQILSYFSNEPIIRGSLILISLRNRPVPAIVLSQSDISSQKTQLKKSSFLLKKINGALSSQPIFSEKEFEFLKWFADYYFLPLGLALKTILPEKLLKAKKLIEVKLPITNYPLRQNSNEASQLLITKPLLYFSDNRADFYIQKIKENLKNNKQSLILFPEYFAANLFFNKIVDIFKEGQISFLSGALTPKKYFDEWLKIAQKKSPIVIGARSAVFQKFSDLGLVIIDEEQDQSFKSWDMRPYYNARECALKLGEIFGAETILGSNTPSIETYHKINSRFKVKSLKPDKKENNIIVDMRDEIKKGNEIISEDLISELEKISENNKQAILFVNRRGSATFIFCQECGFVLKCPDCDSPLVFHKEIKNENLQLICHHCNFSRKTPDICPQCGGFKIKYNGIASQKAEEIIATTFPNLKIKLLDSETVSSPKELTEIISNFKDKKIDVILGTQIILKKNFPKVDLVGILSIDTILNLPEFRINERIYQIIKQLKEYKKDNSTPFLLQTFKPDQEIFNLSLASDFNKMYDDDIEIRKAFNYPPFYQLIKITFKNPDPKIAFLETQKMTEALEKQVLKFISNSTNNNTEPTLSSKSCIVLGPVSGFMPKLRGQYIYNIVIKTNLDIKTRNLILSIIPTKDWSIDVDPVSLI